MTRLLGGHVFQPTVTIFKLIQNIIGNNLLNKPPEKNSPPSGGHFHHDRKINVASRPSKEKCPAPCGYSFKPTGIIFKLVEDIIEMNLLTKFHEDRTINVVSRELTRFHYSHI
ncbi:hypothetical protein DPMN_145421 [Dreissena polymorpha]|uniref:Uncharacterized protein n=1 Tax=Dreissena polymorpha TaxID=45954 RepID=A0A9D4IXH4_DREPO|nr:hypothetical protein DPMN_145421 [Dreissena polymorpha]